MEEKHKYKVGDKVKVKSLDPDKYHESLIDYVGEILTINKVLNNNSYYVNENVWIWDEETLEPVEENVTLKELQEIKKDNIIPTYYHQGNYDVIQFCLDNNIDFVTGNIIKYITRYKGKNGLEDLKKAQEYLKRFEATKNVVLATDLVRLTNENNMTYTQGKIIECVLENNKDLANILIKELIKEEEKKIKEIEETYQTEGMAD